MTRALAPEPRALLLDEPLAALDVETRAAVRGELRAMLAGLAMPTVLVTHDYADALVFRERVVVMDRGQVAQDGPHAELLARPRSRFVAQFTGVNYYEGVLTSTSEASSAAPGALGHVRIDVDVAVSVSAGDLRPGPVSVALRPWDIVLSRSKPGGSARNVLAGRVREALPLGVRVTLAAGARGTLPLVVEITAETQADLNVREGEVLYASFKATAVSVSAL